MRLFLAVILSAIFAMNAMGQIASTTSLAGTITDSNGASIFGAKVTAVNQGTHDTYTKTTNQQGFYSIDFIRIGVYDVTVEQPGFQKVTKSGIVVDISQVVRNDITLTVGALNQSVTIEAVAASIKTDDANVSEIIGVGDVADLPLNGRDPLKLATITAGTISGWKASNWYQDDKTWQGSEQLSWTKGPHTIMAGAELRKLITGRQSGNSPRGICTTSRSSLLRTRL